MFLQYFASSMINRVGLVNRELHFRLFKMRTLETGQPQSHFKKHHLSRQLLLRSLIKQRRNNTSTDTHRTRSVPTIQTRNRRPREHTIQPQSYRQVSQAKVSEDDLKLQQIINEKNKFGVTLAAGIEMLMDNGTAKFDEFDQITNRIAWEKQHETERKKVKLQKYNHRKFSSALKNYSALNGAQSDRGNI